jgi:hypothetical protein
MPKFTYHRTSDGADVDEHTALDAKGVIKDGFTLRTKLTLMDGAPLHRPGSLAMSDAHDETRVAAIIARDARLSEAWRSPQATPSNQVQDSEAAITDPYERYERQLQDAWKQPAL